MKLLRGTIWRAAWLRYGLLAGLVLLVATIAVSIEHKQLYVLNDAELKLIGKSSVEHSMLKNTASTVLYNRAEETSRQTSATVTLASSKMDSTGQVPYQTSVGKDHQAGITFGDASGDMSFKMVPQFDTAAGQYQDGRVVFPEGNDRTHVYTFKRNGIKEDIILAHTPGKTAQYSWKLELGDKLEAKLLPNGSVGVYSANPLLYGNAPIGDGASQSIVDTARTKSAKTNLVFLLPAPYLKDAGGKIDGKDVSFQLKDNVLTLEARNLSSKHYPLSIDPSAVVTTTADFSTGWDDGMIDYSTANEINRSNISLGSVGSTTQQTSAFTGARSGQRSVSYNGYLYIVGGNTGTVQNDIQYCPINSGGSVGSCTQQTNAFTTARQGHTALAYNGFLYIIGGVSATVTVQNDIQYCPINSNGSVGTCVQQTNAFTAARTNHSSVIYNGYVYIIGGTTGTLQNDIQYCPINSGGSVGSCTQQTNAFTTARQGQSSVAYNGFLYIIGGNGGGNRNDIQYCPITASGFVGTCTQQTSAFTTARTNHTSVVYDGYLYIIGGTDGTTNQNDIQYCPVYAYGAVGTCTQQTSAFTTGRSNHSSAIYNGYIYVIGGTDGSSSFDDIQYLPVSTGSASGFGSTATTIRQTSAFTTARNNQTSVAYANYLYIIGGTDGTSSLDDIQYCLINTAGSIVFCTQQTGAFTTGRSSHASAAYNNYLYIIGGNDGTNSLNDIQYCPINSDGSVGSCTQQTNAFTGARQGHTASIYNGYLYIAGGNTGTLQNDIQYCPINSDGSVGSCTQQTNAFTNARTTHTSVAYNGYLYIIGGVDNTPTRLNDIIYCPINSGGSVGSCTQQTNAFTNARSAHASVAYDGYLYIIGGINNSSTRLNDIQYCPFNSNGSVGSCTVQNSAFTNARNALSTAVTNGYIYILGGLTPTRQNDIIRAPVQSPDLSARYDKVIDLGKIADSFDSVAFSSPRACTVRLAYATAGSDGVYGNYTLLSSALPGTTYNITGENNKRYFRIVISFDDSGCGTASNLTDITLAYTKRAVTPTLYTPANGAISVPLLPIFTLRSSDDENDYIRYKIEVCSTSNCSSIIRTIDQTASQTGWSGQDQQSGTAYTGNPVITSSTMATHTYQTPALSIATQYWWRGYAINPGEANTWSLASAIQSFTTNDKPAAPTLVAPASGSTAAPLLPEFQLRTTDPDSDYVQYLINICQDSSCNTVLYTYTQASSQTDWSNQDAGSGNAIAYSTSTTLSNSRMAILRPSSITLSPSTQYWWTAQAKDPAGSNTYSAASAIGTFTTGTQQVRIMGNTSIMGNTKVYN